MDAIRNYFAGFPQPDHRINNHKEIFHYAYVSSEYDVYARDAGWRVSFMNGWT